MVMKKQAVKACIFRRKGLLLTALLLLLSAAVFASGNKAPVPAEPVPGEKIIAYFFYEELCGSCSADEERFLSILREKLPLAERDMHPHSFELINIYEKAGRSRYVQVTGDMGLDRETLEPPLLILGGRVFQGYDSIGSHIREAYFAAGEL